jgi:hypothetical protein
MGHSAFLSFSLKCVMQNSTNPNKNSYVLHAFLLLLKKTLGSQRQRNEALQEDFDMLFLMSLIRTVKSALSCGHTGTIFILRSDRHDQQRFCCLGALGALVMKATEASWLQERYYSVLSEKICSTRHKI